MNDIGVPSYSHLIGNDAQIKAIMAISDYISRWKMEVDAMEATVPDDASPTNKLATESSVATNSATFRGNYNLVTDLGLTPAATHSDIEAALATAVTTVDNNDYCWVDIPTSEQTPAEIAATERYKYDGSTSTWGYEFTPTPAFSAAQWAALNSGITAALVEAFGAKYNLPTGGIPKTDLASDVQISLGKADTAVQDAYSTTQADNKFVDSTQIRHIVSMTQAEYDLITPDANTLYYII